MAQPHENPNTAEKAEKARQGRYGTSKGTRKLVEPEPKRSEPKPKRTGPKPKRTTNRSAKRS